MGNLRIARGLTWRYVIALSLVASLSTAAWFSLHLVISEQKSTAAVVNVSGRQRMLSQRTALFSHMLVNAPAAERSAVRGKLEEAIQLMAHSHHGLIHGDAAMGLPGTMSATVRAMYFDGNNPLDNQVETYIKTVRELVQLNDADLTASNPLLQYITQNAPTTLVAGLDRMVGQYQLEGESAVKRLQRVETVFWLITLLLLALEAALIFHPFVKHIKIILGQLQYVTGELQLHRDQLEEKIKQRTAELETQRTALAESEEKFRLISTAAKDAIVIIGRDERVMYWNPAAEKIFGYEAQEAVGRNLHQFLVPEDHRDSAHKGFERFSREGGGPVIGVTLETTAIHKNGAEFPIELSISAFRLQETWHALGLIRDITERKRMEEQVRQLAFYDPLTNLPNRRLLDDRLNQAMAVSKRNGLYAAFMVLDLDNFKSLNDTHGHVVGDRLLVEAANRLKACVRQADTIARFGGDEFVVLLSELSADQSQSAAQAGHIANKIRLALSEPYHLLKQQGGVGIRVEHRCSASIGVTVFVGDDVGPEDIFKSADAAMYQAKAAGRNQIRLFNQWPLTSGDQYAI